MARERSLEAEKGPALTHARNAGTSTKGMDREHGLECGLGPQREIRKKGAA